MDEEIEEYTLEKEFAEYKMQYMRSRVYYRLLAYYRDLQGTGFLLSFPNRKTPEEQVNNEIDKMLATEEGIDKFIKLYYESYNQ